MPAAHENAHELPVNLIVNFSVPKSKSFLLSYFSHGLLRHGIGMQDSHKQHQM